MYVQFESHYVLCILEDNKIVATQNFISQSELWEAIEENQDNDYVGLEWMEISEDTKMIWILEDNISYSDEEDLDLLMIIYAHLFDMDETWRNKYI